MRLTREARQRIVDEYLDATGAESVRPRDFLAWLEPLVDHAAWRLFFGRDEADLARERREQLVRAFISDLRIRVRYAAPRASGVTTVRVAEVPMLVSPLSMRSTGGGYMRVEGAAGLEAVRAEAVQALRAWLKRYRGAFEAAGGSVSAVEQFLDLNDEAAVPTEDRAAAGGLG